MVPSVADVNLYMWLSVGLQLPWSKYRGAKLGRSKKNATKMHLSRFGRFRSLLNRANGTGSFWKGA